MAEDGGGKRKKKRHQNKAAYRCKHRLASIQYDVKHHVDPCLAKLPNFPLLANERCGIWYGYPFMKDTCRFKSTDGHEWFLSLKRLNLNVVRHAVTDGGCILVDASASKGLPDSFSRTIPLWAAVLNRIVVRYRRELHLEPMEPWDDACHLPECSVSQREREHIVNNILESRVESLYQSRAIVDPDWLVRSLDKPLRPVFVTPLSINSTIGVDWSSDCYPIICLSCSNLNASAKEFLYSPGAADDEESWSHHMTAKLFWDNIDRINGLGEDETDAVVAEIVRSAGVSDDWHETASFDWIGELNMAIGSRRSGRPPECWENFDAILNVTEIEYPEMGSNQRDDRFYLQLPVKEGKRDKSELERWMPVGAAFVLFHLQQRHRILIHCAQGKDRSIAVAMVVIILFCHLQLPLRWKDGVHLLNLRDLFDGNGEMKEAAYGCSGLPKSLVDAVFGHKGKDKLLNWLRRELFPELQAQDCLASKDSLRLALLLLKQDREKADPSRSTMQKVNRFFMSDNSFYS